MWPSLRAILISIFLLVVSACGGPEARRSDDAEAGGHKGSIDATCRELLNEASAKLPDYLKAQPGLSLRIRAINNLTRADVDASAIEDRLRETIQDLKIELHSDSETILSGELREIDGAREELGPVDWQLILTLKNADQILWSGNARRPRPRDQLP